MMVIKERTGGPNCCAGLRFKEGEKKEKKSVSEALKPKPKAVRSIESERPIHRTGP